MTPNELYILPAIAAEPWYACYGNLEAFFGADMYFDRDRAREDSAGDVVLQTKLRCMLDWGERSVSYTAVTFRGRPIGLIMSGGRGESDDRQAMITDADGYWEARAYIMRWLDAPAIDVVDPDADNVDLGGHYGTLVVSIGDRTELVRRNRVTADGTLLFDDAAYHRAFEKTVRPAYKAAGREAETGLAHRPIRDAAIRAILAGVPEGLDARILDTEDLEGCDPKYLQNYWHAVAIGGPSGTYTVGLSSLSGRKWLSWGNDIDINRVGPRAMFDRLAEEADGPADAPSGPTR